MTNNEYRRQKGMKIMRASDFIGNYERLEAIKEYFKNEPLIFHQKGQTDEQIKNDKILQNIRTNSY